MAASSQAATAFGSSLRSKGAELEQRIATAVQAMGYEVQTNVILEGRSGARHEIDVLGVKRDALSSFRVAIECKAWDQPIEKDVVAKFSYVLNDLGLREGIIVALGGSRSGADTAAAELGITIWGPDDIREKLGAVMVADLRSGAPTHAGSGLPITTDEATAHAMIERQARGKLGVGSETVVWTSLVWLPIAVVQLALSRTEGRLKKVTQTRRIWNAYDQIDGGLVSSWSATPPITDVDLARRSLRPKQRESSFPGAVNEAVKKYRSVSTDAARARHAQRLASLGIPTGFAVVPESVSSTFVPLYVGIAQRKSAERLIVIDAHRGELHQRLSTSLSHNIHWLRESLA